MRQEANDTQVKKKITVNNNVKRTPVVINIENNFYYVKKNDAALRRLAAEVESLKSRMQ